MKKILTTLVILVLSVSLSAQNKGQKMESNKIAYISTKMALTTEEAQIFWPVYNEIAAAQKAQNKALQQARKALRQAMFPKDGAPRDEAAIATALKVYNDALASHCNVLPQYYEKLIGILPAEKVARYYLAEESFRRDQINKMKGYGNQGGHFAHPQGHKAPAEQK